MEITYRVALERDGQVIFDSDMEALLRAIDAYQNLHTATKQLNLSYRHAWDRLRTSEERLGIKLVDNCIRGRGMQVTLEAKTILSKFETLKRNVATSINWPSLTMTVQNAIINQDEQRKHRNEKAVKAYGATMPMPGDRLSFPDKHTALAMT